MSTERTWYLNSERPVTAADLPVYWWADGLPSVVFSDSKSGVPYCGVFQWTHAEKRPPPPKPREKSQAELDLETWNRRFDSFDFDKGLAAFSAHIRADQEAKTKAELGNRVEQWIADDRAYFIDLRDIFAPTTKQEEKP